MWLEKLQKLALNTDPFIENKFIPSDSAYTNQILFVRDSGETETSTGSPTGYIYLNGIKYGDGLDTYINSVTYINGEDNEHPYSLEFNYIDGTKQTFYVTIDDIDNLYTEIDSISAVLSTVTSGDVSRIGHTIISANYESYFDSESGAIISLHLMNGDVQNINVTDIDYIIENYQPIYDDGLITSANTVSGAINEIYNLSLDNKDNIDIMANIIYELSGTVDALREELGNAYVNSYYDGKIRELGLIKYNGQIDKHILAGGGGSGHCHCCCPIVEIMKDGDSWIQKLGRRVTDIENYIYNQSGDIENIIYCVDDLEKRVKTIENELDLDDNMIVDYTTVPVSAWSLNSNAVVVTSIPNASGYGLISVTDDEGTNNPYAYISMHLDYKGSVNIDLYADFDGDITVEDFGINSDNFLKARILKTNGKYVTLSNFSSLQSYFEDFTDKIKDATITLSTGEIITMENAIRIFERAEYILDSLNSIGINEDSFEHLEVLKNDTISIIDDLDDSIAFIISHIKDLYYNTIQLQFVVKDTIEDKEEE